MTVGCRGDWAFHWHLQFDFECHQLSDALGLSDIKNLFTILIIISPHHVFKICEKPSQVTGLTVLVMKSQLFFADSLTSTLLDWLIYATCLSVLTRLHSHIQLMLEWVLSLYFLATSKRSSINPRPRLQLVLVLLVIDGVSLLVEQTHDKFSKDFSKQFWWGYRWSLYRLLMCNDFLLWSVVETRLILQDGFLDLLFELGWYLVKVGVFRTWSHPIDFNCPSAVFGNCPQFGRDYLFRVEFYVVEFWRVYFCPLVQGLLP